MHSLFNKYCSNLFYFWNPLPFIVKSADIFYEIILHLYSLLTYISMVYMLCYFNLLILLILSFFFFFCRCCLYAFCFSLLLKIQLLFLNFFKLNKRLSLALVTLPSLKCVDFFSFKGQRINARNKHRCLQSLLITCLLQEHLNAHWSHHNRDITLQWEVSFKSFSAPHALIRKWKARCGIKNHQGESTNCHCSFLNRCLANVWHPIHNMISCILTSLYLYSLAFRNVSDHNAKPCQVHQVWYTYLETRMWNLTKWNRCSMDLVCLEMVWMQTSVEVSGDTFCTAIPIPRCCEVKNVWINK